VYCVAASPFEADQSPHRTIPAYIAAGKMMPVPAVLKPYAKPATNVSLAKVYWSSSQRRHEERPLQATMCASQ
jgi:hypothetical protein